MRCRERPEWADIVEKVGKKSSAENCAIAHRGSLTPIDRLSKSIGVIADLRDAFRAERVAQFSVASPRP